MNGSTGNPQPSVVMLLTSSGECGRAMTNDSGEFLIINDVKRCPQAGEVLKVTLDGVDYFQPTTAGQFTTFKVYHSANRVSPITGSLSILQFQTIDARLEVMELHALNNLSIPPTTQTNPGNFLVSIPSGAGIEPAVISSPDGGTIKVPLVSMTGSTDQYEIDFPIKPGVTKYAIRYQLPYKESSVVFRRPIQYPMDRLGIIIPKSMHLRLISPISLQLVAGAPGAQEQQFELDKVAANTTLSLALSGSGELAHSFRPIQHEKHVAFTMSVPQSKVDSPIVPPATPIPTSQSSRPANYQYTVAIGILLLFGASLWSLIRGRKSAISLASHFFSTDANSSSSAHETAEPERREAPGKHR